MRDLRTLLQQMPYEDRRWLLGNDTKNGLTEGFDHKRVVHAGVNGRPIMDPEEQQRVWKQHMNEPFTGSLRSAYIHVPFCEKKCSYCGFFQNASNEEIMSRYTDLLIEEIKMTAEYERARTGTFNTVYFGGGTPSTLAPKDIVRLVHAVREYLPLANDCEITLESRIHDMDEEHIAAAKEAGINRFSLGVQSFDTKIRQAVGRIDEKQVVIERLERLLKEDYATVVIDLMFGLPYQTMETWMEDLRIQDALGLHGGDMYQLNLFPDSDLAKQIEAGKLPAVMSTPEQALLYAHTVEYLKARKPHVHMFDPSHWARDRRERNIYNGAAKKRADMLCFGSSAGGRVGSLQLMQHRNLKAYMAAMEAGLKPIAMMIDDGNSSLLQGEIKAQMEDCYLDGSYFKSVWNMDLTGYLSPIIEAWVDKGLVTYAHDVMRFTTAGMFWHDNLIQAVTEAVAMGEEEGTAMRYERVAHQDKVDTKMHAPINNEAQGHIQAVVGKQKAGNKKPEAKCPHGYDLLFSGESKPVEKPMKIEEKPPVSEKKQGRCPHGFDVLFGMTEKPEYVNHMLQEETAKQEIEKPVEKKGCPFGFDKVFGKNKK